MLLALRTRLLAASPEIIRLWWNRLQGSALGYRLAKGAFWSLLGALMSRGLVFLSGIVAARLLGKGEFGELAIIQSTAGMFGTIAGLGLGLTATKYIAQLRSDPPRTARILSLSAVLAWTSGAIASCVLLLSAPLLAAYSLNAPHLTSELRAASGLVLLGAVNGAQNGALAGFEAFRAIAKLSVFTGGASFIFLCVGVFSYGVEGGIWGLVIAQALGCLLTRMSLGMEASRLRVLLWSSEWKKELSVLWRFSIPAAIGSVLVMPVYWMMQAALTIEHGFSAVAEYSVGAQWRALVFVGPSLIASSFFPVYASIDHKNTAERKKIVLLMPILLGGIAVLIAGPLFALSPVLLDFYGSEFRSASMTVNFLLVAAILDAATLPLTGAILGAGHAWVRLVSNACWATCVLLLSPVLIPRFGAPGLAAALVLGQSLHFLVQGLVTARILKLDAIKYG